MCRQPTLILTTAVAVLSSAAGYAQEAGRSTAEDSAPAPALPPPPADQAPSPYSPPTWPPPAYAYPPPASYGPPPGYYYPAQPPAYYAPQPTAPQGPQPGDHTHDGFFLSLRPGIGILHAKYNYGGYDTTISGAGPALSLALGGAVTPNLILYGEILSVRTSSPTVDSRYGSSGFGSDIGLFGMGPGLAYYVQPSNLYVAGTVALSWITTNSTSSSFESSADGTLTDVGFGLAVTVGKEWWVSPNWGLGVAGALHVASMRMQSVDARMTAEGISILFSATYN